MSCLEVAIRSCCLTVLIPDRQPNVVSLAKNGYVNDGVFAILFQFQPSVFPAQSPGEAQGWPGSSSLPPECPGIADCFWQIPVVYECRVFRKAHLDLSFIRRPMALS